MFILTNALSALAIIENISVENAARIRLGTNQQLESERGAHAGPNAGARSIEQCASERRARAFDAYQWSIGCRWHGQPQLVEKKTLADSAFFCVDSMRPQKMGKRLQTLLRKRCGALVSSSPKTFVLPLCAKTLFGLQIRWRSSP